MAEAAAVAMTSPNAAFRVLMLEMVARMGRAAGRRPRDDNAPNA